MAPLPWTSPLLPRVTPPPPPVPSQPCRTSDGVLPLPLGYNSSSTVANAVRPGWKGGLPCRRNLGRHENRACQVPRDPRAPRAGAGCPGSVGGSSGPCTCGDPRFPQQKHAQAQEGALLEDSRRPQWNSRAGGARQRPASRTGNGTFGGHCPCLWLSSFCLAFKIILIGCLLRTDSETQ